MLRSCLALFVVLAMSGCATVESQMTAHPMPYGCNDLVVVGRVKSLSEHSIDTSAAVLGQSVWNVEVAIKRVVHGKERRGVVPAVGVSDAQIREDLDLLIVLSRSGDREAYRISTLNVAEGSRLAEQCTAKSA